ncbi:MAG: hypothetical protein AAGF77_07855 [Bacteroidota bacterium]
MDTFYNIATGSVNLPLTLFLGLLLLYWLFSVVLGLDFDVDADIDVAVDADVDVDVESGGSVDFQDVGNTEIKKDNVVRRRGKLNPLQVFLLYFNFVGLPFMFTLTAFVLFWWGISVTGTAITHSYNHTFGYLFFFGGLVPALFVTKIFTTPFKAFFKNFNNKGASELELLGREGTLTSALSGDKMTTLEVMIMDDPIKVLVQSKGGEAIPAHSKVAIVGQVKSKSIYLIQKTNY